MEVLKYRLTMKDVKTSEEENIYFTWVPGTKYQEDSIFGIKVTLSQHCKPCVSERECYITNNITGQFSRFFL